MKQLLGKPVNIIVFLFVMTRLISSLCLFFAFSCSDNKEARLQQFLLKGNLATKQRSFDQAAYYFGEAIRVEPCYADAWNNLGTVYFEQGRFELAMEKYSKAIECQPGFLNALLNRANTAYELKEYYKAIEDLDRVAAIKPDTALVYFTKGLVFTKMRKFDNALDAFAKSIQLDPTNIDHKVNHAIVHFYRKDFDLAKLELEKLAKVKKDEPNIYNTLSLIETEQGNYQEALEMVNKAILLDPKQSYFLNNRGFIFLSLKEMEKAEADINESISADPYNAWAYRNKGVFYLMKGDYPSAERLLKQSLDMDNFVDKIYFYLGMAYLKDGKTALACTAFKKSEELGDKMMTTDLVKACK